MTCRAAPSAHNNAVIRGSTKQRHRAAHRTTEKQLTGSENKWRSLKESLEDEHRVFQQRWEEEFAFVEVDSKPICLICQKAIAVMKRDNLRRHHENLHLPKFANEYPPGSYVRKEHIKTLKTGLCGQQLILLLLLTSSLPNKLSSFVALQRGGGGGVCVCVCVCARARARAWGARA